MGANSSGDVKFDLSPVKIVKSVNLAYICCLKIDCLMSPKVRPVKQQRSKPYSN